MITEIIPGVYSVDQAVADGKNAIVVGERAVWAIDTGTHAHEGQEMADFIRGLGREADRLIYTHGHGDHALGSAAFRGAEMIVAHDLMPVEARRLLPGLAERAGKSVDEMSAQIAWPTITFSHELTLDLGDRRLHLFPTPGHSQDGVSVYLPDERLLIAGDAVVNGIVPAIGDGDSRILEQSLEKLAMLDIETLVPGHGFVVRGREATRDWIVWLASYLRSVRAAVRERLDAGDEADAVADGISYDEFIGDRLPKERHGMPKRHRDTVQKIISEERTETAGVSR